MRRTFIPIAAACTIALLSTTEWGTLYATLRSFGREPAAAQVTLEGFTMPHVTAEFGAKSEENNAEKIIRIATEDATDAKEHMHAMNAPLSWKLQEVSGVSIRDVKTSDGAGVLARYELDATVKISFPLVFTFRTRDAIETISFSHDSPHPALLDLRSANLENNQTQRTVELVRKTRTIDLSW